MKLYTLWNNTANENFNCMWRCLVWAKDEKSARKLAANNHLHERRKSWLNPQQTNCTEISLTDRSKIIDYDYSQH
jgi:uncharacterized membrane protein